MSRPDRRRLTTNNTAHHSEPSYKRHTAVDGERGVVLDAAVKTGAVHDTKPTEERLGAVSAATGSGIRVATVDAGYAITRVFAALEERGIEAVVPAKAEPPPKKGTVPVGRFKLDAKDRVVRCPGGKLLRPHGKPDGNGFQRKRARVPDCRSCRLRPIRFSPAMKRQAILLHKDDPALLLARRKYARRGATSARSTEATASAWKASSARRKPSTARPAPSGAASLTCGSRPTSLPPPSISNGWRLSSCACCSQPLPRPRDG